MSSGLCDVCVDRGPEVPEGCAMPASASSPDSPDDDSSSGRFSGSSDHGSSPVNDPNPEHDDPCTGADRSVTCLEPFLTTPGFAVGC